MRLSGILWSAISATALFVGVGAQGCSPTNDASPQLVRCTPGAFVTCKCQDQTDGTKLCKATGDSFEACTVSGGECVGGEDLTNPDKGKPVDPDGGPIKTDSGPTSELDVCPGKPTSVGEAQIVVEGDTTGATDTAKGKTGACAVGGGGPDHIYHLQPTGSGALSIKVQGAGALNPTVYLRTACADEASQVACAETTGVAGVESTTYNVTTGQSYFLFVDGASGSAGKYTLTMKLTTGTFCGDGKVSLNEACDDTNHVPDDGCSPGCDGISGDPTSGNSCPGQPVHVWPGKVVTGTGSTLPYGNTFMKTGTSCTVSAGNLNVAQDHVYAVTAHGAGNLKVTLTPEATFNAMLVARTTCADPNSQAANMCANLNSTGGVEVMTFPVTSGQTVYVAADGVLSGKGNYTIKFELP